MHKLLFVLLVACGGGSPQPLPIIDGAGTTSPTAPTDGRIVPVDAGNVFLDGPPDAPPTILPDAL